MLITPIEWRLAYGWLAKSKAQAAQRSSPSRWTIFIRIGFARRLRVSTTARQSLLVRRDAEMNAVKWVLIDSTNGATTQDGSTLSLAVLAHIAEAVQNQVNQEFAAEWGAQATLRVGANANDIQPGEWAYGFVGSLPDAPGASAYHDINGTGVPFALCAVTTCSSLFGPDGVSVDASHEILETAGDEGANQFANDNKGLLHAVEMCDAVEIQTYGKTCKDGTVVQVSNWLLRAWFIPGSAGPYDYMTST